MWASYMYFVTDWYNKHRHFKESRIFLLEEMSSVEYDYLSTPVFIIKRH